MLKKDLMLLIVFLLSLPGCGGRCKKTSGVKGKKVAQHSRFGLPLAADEIRQAGDEVRSFFDDDMQDFVAFGQEDDFDNAHRSGSPDDYSWLNENAEKRGLQTAYFDFDRYSIKPEERKKAEYNAKKLKNLIENDNEVTVVVEGHACASAGSSSYNLALSERRAKSYADFLQANGIPADRLKRVGRGKEMLVLKEGGREEQWVNRRVELHPVHDTNVA